MINELIERCIENDNYIGLIAVKYDKNKELIYNKIYNKVNKNKKINYGINCRCEKYNNRIRFNNGSYIFILDEVQTKYYRGNKYNYAIIDNDIEKFYIDNCIECKLIPYTTVYGNILSESVIEYFDINYSIEELKQLCENNPYFVGLVITNLERKNIKQLKFDNGSILTSCYYKNLEINELIKVYNNRVLIDKDINFNLDLEVHDYTLCDSCNGYLCGECRECERDKDKVLIKGEIIKY